ncbi:MAG: hypothetical protein J6K25_08460 [Thermoguttaceae bacterium]|nr:hypothetical protein [Thermoguttaceae bacterium]
MSEEKRTVVTSQKPVVFYDIFIAGPGDVYEERLYIRDKILLWTRDNAETTGIHLRPRMWELDSPGGTWPKDHERPEKNSSQWIIDEKVVKRCDYLLAVFADKLGFQSEDKYPSGTAREIDIHASSGKPAKIFFCTSPYEGNDPEKKQERQRLDEYRQTIERQEYPWVAAYHPYPREKFEVRFDVQFDLLIKEIKEQAIQDFKSLEPVKTPLPHEILLLLASADCDKDDGFRVFYTLPFGEKDFGNYVISAAGKFYNKQPKEANHKQTAHWKSIVELALREELFVKDDPTTSYVYSYLAEKVDIMEQIHLYKTFDLFRLTLKGYEAVEELKRQEERGEKDYVLYRSTP